MNTNLVGKNALVCGSSKGLGKASAVEIARLGANVTLVARSGDKLAAVANELDTSLGQDHDFLIADFSEPKDLRKKVLGLLSAKPIHILINNTGGPAGGPIVDADPEAFKIAFEKHLVVSHMLTQMILPSMKAAGYGRIINITSTSIKAPIDGLGVSNTIRAAMANWAKTTANEVAKFGITVNNLLPGMTMTDRLRELITHWATERGITEAQLMENMKQQIPLGRFAEPHEIGEVVAFLASPAAGYVTGTNITVDGGRTKSL